MSERIAVLVVTFNRLDKLKKCLKHYEWQTYKPSLIIVVDNNSNDGTKDFLTEWRNEDSFEERVVISLNNNLGGSGGFYTGMKASLDYEFDWLWIADDDAYPDKDAFKLLVEKSNPNYSVICSSVYNVDGIDLSHRKIENNTILGISAPKSFYAKEYFPIVCFSFVGACIRKDVIKKCGFPNKDFFIWYDDTEYSIRVKENYEMICIPSIKVFHDTIIEKEWKYSWKTYYGERNMLYTLKSHLPKLVFMRYLIHYRLGMIKHFFTDHKYYLSQRDGYTDFKKGITGVPEDHKPGKYKY